MDFDRKEAKILAKQILNKNYWRMVLAGLALAFAVGKLTQNSVTYKIDDITEEMQYLEITLTVVLIAAAAILLKVFVLYPLEFGGTKFFLRSITEQDGGNIMDGFSPEYRNRVISTFLYRDVMILLFSLLLVFPGMVKAYQYYFVGQLLADHPEMSGKDVCQLSAEMTKGLKWKLFVLDLSFILWEMASSLTCGLTGVFYSNPYQYQTRAVVYHDLVLQGADPAR